MATITKRGRGYRVQVRLRGRKPLSKTFRTHALATRWAREVEHSLERSEMPSEADLGALIDKYLEEVYAVRPRHRTGLAHYRRLGESLAGVRVSALTPEWWMTWARGQTVSPVSRMRYLTEIVGVLRTAEALWDISVPWRAIAAGRRMLLHHGLIDRGRHRQRRITDAELDAIKAAAPAVTAIPLADIIDLALLTALRQAEITRLAWADLDRGRRVILVRDRKHPRQKAGNDSEIPLLGDAFEIICRQPQRPNEPRIFPWGSESVGTAFRRAASGAGVTGLRFHDLRHEATTRLLESGYSVAETALVTGHKDWNMLRRYTHLRADDLHRGPAARRKSDPAVEESRVECSPSQGANEGTVRASDHSGPALTVQR